MDKELRIGVVGTGAIGRTHLERINTQLQGGRVVAVSDVNKEFGKSVAEKYGCKFFEDGEELINSDEVDAIIVTTIDAYHEQYVSASIKAGKYVFCEKPLAAEKEGTKRIVDLEMAGGKKLVTVGFMRRYDPGYKQLKKLVEERTYGEPLMLHCAHRNYGVDESYDNSMPVENSMIHEIDVLRWLLDEDYATAEVVYPKKTKYAHEKLQDPQIMILTTKSGVRIDVEAFINSHYGYDIKCEVCCEEGIVNLPEPANAMVRTKAARITPICEDWSQRFVEAYNVELQEWINAVKAGRVDGPSSWDGYVGAITASAASKARDSQTIVKIEMEECPDFYK
ncbi:Gfo/Idh/MocA family protein [Anaerotalea alkaliphila]|uniref:Inositol 2-dehydrogenase/D-chiro-inositol 3-dehydrogenase n=1 Tax=Anaerotalea alkaliphila TaxID=2662126 RepID=A0A7X5HTN5_9FIRM|nr:Gfo/Idh/MocA family oxidoreductase [Anaerotalea alkaliphila]NDL66444.1 Gfo/Idh/MocA family oxidoreductase [Anaerotalea alkaliphila]